MSKAVLISIKPKWCELIANGKKTVEVRKTRPRLEAPFKCYIYMTSGDASIRDGKGMVHHHSGGRCVIGEFMCSNIECFTTDYRMDKEQTERISQQSCVDMVSLAEYERNARCLYGWHISNLKIYKKPLKLDRFRKPIDCHRGKQREDCVGCWDCEIKRPPQSWCYVEELKGGDEG